MHLKTLINNNKILFDRYFIELLRKNLTTSILSKAMIYGAMNGGKRIRPFLVYQASKINNLSNNNYFVLASCIELIHSYSLIHDDLPSMDDDDYRRGKLSAHKKFDEATAILAGDALHDLAFELLSSKLLKIEPSIILKLINNLSKSIGYKGLAGGQSLDLFYEKKKISKKKIIDMYKQKTGKLFEFSFSAPFIINNKSIELINFSKEYGMLFGLLFQITDDYIDEKKTFKQLGKTPGKDKKQDKSTLFKDTRKKEIFDYCNYRIEKFIKTHSKNMSKYNKLEKILKFSLDRIN